MKFFSINEKKQLKDDILIIFIYYSFIMIPFFYLTSKLGFISDDLILLKSAIINHFPVLSKWIVSNSYLYRPVAIFSFYLNYLISEYSPYSYYLTNIFIHIVCTLLVFLILVEIISTKQKSTSLIPSFILSIVFLTVPQNITNVLWISGRTDLLCGMFIFASIYILLRYLKTNRLSYIIIALLLYILSLMCKETAVIAIIYLILIIAICNLYKIQINYKKALSLYVLITILYLVFRYSIFGANIFNKMSAEQRGMFPAIKYIIYGISSLFSPVGTLDLFYFFKFKDLFFYIIIFLSIVFVGFFLLLVFKYSNRKDIKILFLSLFLVTVSLLIYIKAYPQMRLMYLHYPIILIGLALIINNFKNHLGFKLIIPMLLLGFFLLGNILVVSRAIKINGYYNELKNVLPSSIEYKKLNSCYILTPLGRLSETWADPYVGLIASLKYSKSLKNKYNKFKKVVFIEGYSLSKFDDNMRYKTDSSNIIIKVNDGLGLVPFPSEKFYNESIENNSYIIKPLDFKKYRKGIASEMLIHFKSNSINKNSDIIYFDEGRLIRENLNQFLKTYSSFNF